MLELDIIFPIRDCFGGPNPWKMFDSQGQGHDRIQVPGDLSGQRKREGGREDHRIPLRNLCPRQVKLQSYFIGILPQAVSGCLSDMPESSPRSALGKPDFSGQGRVE